MSGKPLLWDMYKWAWGWNEEDSEGFLEYIDADEKYRQLHAHINLWKKWDVGDILSIQAEWKNIDSRKIPDFRETTQKTLDKIGFSL